MSRGTTRIAAIKSVKPIRFNMTPPRRFLLDLEELFRVVFKDHFLLSSAQKFEAFDDMPCFAEPLPGFRVFYGADAGTLRSEQATIRANRLEEQRKGVRGIENCV